MKDRLKNTIKWCLIIPFAIAMTCVIACFFALIGLRVWIPPLGIAIVLGITFVASGTIMAPCYKSVVQIALGVLLLLIYIGWLILFYNEANMYSVLYNGSFTISAFLFGLLYRGDYLS
jgi:hypothetical protein